MTTITIELMGKMQTFEGNIIQTPKWAGDQVAMDTTIPDFPMRLFQKRIIRLVDGKPFKGHVDVNDEALTYVVLGDKEKRYQVRDVNGRMQCHCTGFSFRATCRHVEIAKVQQQFGLGLKNFRT
jgi:hypothetical protein